jgi:hypothetical protein
MKQPSGGGKRGRGIRACRANASDYPEEIGIVDDVSRPSMGWVGSGFGFGFGAGQRIPSKQGLKGGTDLWKTTTPMLPLQQQLDARMGTKNWWGRTSMHDQTQIQNRNQVRALALGSKGCRLPVAIARTTTRSSPKATAVTAGGRFGTTWCVGSGFDRPDVDVCREREHQEGS